MNDIFKQSYNCIEAVHNKDLTDFFKKEEMYKITHLSEIHKLLTLDSSVLSCHTKGNRISIYFVFKDKVFTMRMRVEQSNKLKAYREAFGGLFFKRSLNG